MGMGIEYPTADRIACPAKEGDILHSVHPGRIGIQTEQFLLPHPQRPGHPLPGHIALSLQNLLRGELIGKGQPLPEEAIVPHELAAILQTAIPYIHIFCREPLHLFRRSQHRDDTAGHIGAVDPVKAQIVAGAVLGSGEHNRPGTGVGRPWIVFPVRPIHIAPEAAALPGKVRQIFSGKQNPVDLLPQVLREPQFRTPGCYGHVRRQRNGFGAIQQIHAGFDDHLCIACRSRIPEAGPEGRGIIPQAIGCRMIRR